MTPSHTVGPIFIGGSNRSGTTIISLLLQSDPQLTGIGKEEAKFHSALHGPSDGPTPTLADVLEDRAELTEFLAAMRDAWWRFETRTGDPRGIHRFASRADFETALDEFESGFDEDRWSAGAALLNSVVGGDASNVRWVEASPSNARVASSLAKCFPAMRFVHPVRDGRDVAWSISTQPHWGPNSFDEALELWERQIREANAGLRDVSPNQLLYLNFEDLAVFDRERAFGRLIDFLELDESPEMRRFFDVHVTSEDAEIGNWRRGLPDEAQERIASEYAQIVESLAAEGIRAAYHLPSREPKTAARAESLEERLVTREYALQRQLRSQTELAARLGGERDGLERERERLERLADAERERAVQLEDRLRDVEGRAQRLEVALAELRGAHARERERAERLVAVQEESVRERASERERLERLADAERARAAQLAGRIAEFEDGLREVEDRAARLQAQLAEEQEGHAHNRERLSQLSAEQEKLRRERHARTAERDQLASQLAEHSARVAELEERSERQNARLLAIQASASYRIMRIGWRIKAFLRRPFSRRRGLPEAEADEAIEPGAAQARESGPEPGAVQVAPTTARIQPPSVTGSDGGADTKLTVAGVLDTMSRMCFEPECDLIAPSPLDWREQLDIQQPALLLVESAWGGNEGAWRYRIASYPHPDFADLRDLKELLAGCRARSIPTVFWNKEDPVHFERFAAAAALFDAVLTTDAGCIARYEQLGVERVGALPFAAQPLLHNPIPRAGERIDAPCFAGSYYRDRHEARQAAQEMLLDAARPHGLVIYDRTHGTADGAFGFPERFQPHVAGGLSYPQVLSAYRRYAAFLNANSVTDSPTMFSRRVFELLACDTPVVSTESVGIEEMFGAGVPIVRAPQEAGDAIAEALAGGEAVERRVIEARRLVLREHTYRSRLQTIARIAGVEGADRAEPRPGIVLLADDDDGLTRIAAEARDQRLEAVSVGVVCRDGAESADRVAPVIDRDPVAIPAGSDDPPEVVVHRAAELMDCDWLAVFRPDCTYGPGHVEDLVSCSQYANADAIGSSARNGAGTRRRQLPADFLDPGSVLVRCAYVRSHGWPLDPDGAPAGPARLFAADGDAFAARR